MKATSITQELIYKFTNQIGRISLFSFFSRKKASAILFRTKSSETTFPKSKNTIYRTISETAMFEKNVSYQSKEHTTNIKAICVGRINYFKGFILAVKGFHHFLQLGGKGTLELFGEGAEKDEIESYININGLGSSIFVRGFVDNAHIKKRMKKTNILLHPSFREGGSWSIMEAMSHGLPVICLNTSGPKDMVTENCGMLINLKSKQQVCEDIGKALMVLSQDEAKYSQLSTNARNRITNEYSWSKRKDQISQVYEDVLNM